MPLTRRICLSLLVGVALVAIISASSQAIQPGKISEVSVSPDMRRVTIKSDGVIGPHTVTTANNPSRLMIDVEGADIARPPQVNGTSKPAALVVKVVKNPSGARVVLDFGASRLPGHKIRRLGNYLLVFLQEWEPKPSPSCRIAPEKECSSDQNVPVVRRKIENPSDAPTSELSIKSARVVDGLIVLTLASRDNPGVTYRIDLGVDFEKLGFNTARISASDPSSLKPIKVWAKRSPFWTEEAEFRMGPRKSPPPSTTVQQSETKLGRTAKLSGLPW